MPDTWIKHTRIREEYPWQAPTKRIQITALRVVQPNCSSIGCKVAKQVGRPWLIPRITMHQGTDALRKDDGCELVFGIKRADVTTKDFAHVWEHPSEGPNPCKAYAPGEGSHRKSVCSGLVRGSVGDTTREIRQQLHQILLVNAFCQFGGKLLCRWDEGSIATSAVRVSGASTHSCCSM